MSPSLRIALGVLAFVLATTAATGALVAAGLSESPASNAASAPSMAAPTSTRH